MNSKKQYESEYPRETTIMTTSVDHELDDHDDDGNFQLQLEQPLPTFENLAEFELRNPATAVIQDFGKTRSRS
jgi:flagellar assembly factor FliW